jgi:hypothetical protein
MTDVLVLEAADGSRLAIEAVYPPGSPGDGGRPVMRGRVDDVVDEVHERFEDVLERLRGSLEPLVGSLRDIAADADDVEIQFGVGFTAEAGVVISSLSGGANFSITIRWKRGPAP